MRLNDELTALRAEIDALAHGPATVHEWCRADRRTRFAILEAAVCHAHEALEELLVLHLCIECRIADLEAGRE
jgi:hypothetical protein